MGDACGGGWRAAQRLPQQAAGRKRCPRRKRWKVNAVAVGLAPLAAVLAPAGAAACGLGHAARAHRCRCRTGCRPRYQARKTFVQPCLQLGVNVLVRQLVEAATSGSNRAARVHVQQVVCTRRAAPSRRHAHCAACWQSATRGRFAQLQPPPRGYTLLPDALAVTRSAPAGADAFAVLPLTAVLQLTVVLAPMTLYTTIDVSKKTTVLQLLRAVPI
jgi:hypothetical protein